MTDEARMILTRYEMISLSKKLNFYEDLLEELVYYLLLTNNSSC